MLDRMWQRFQSSRIALIAVVVVGAAASIATSPSDEVSLANWESGAFVLSESQPMAEITVTFNASAGTLRDLASLQLEATGLSLDASSAADLAATFDGRQIEIDEASRFVFPCVAECVGYHTIRFDLLNHAAPVVVDWKVTAMAEVSIDDLPDGALLEVAATSSVPETTMQTLYYQRSSMPAELHDFTLSIDTEAAISRTAELWLGLPRRDQEAVVNASTTGAHLRGGGATRLPIPEECYAGACQLEVEIATGPLASYMWFVIGQEGISGKKEVVSNSEAGEGG